MAGVTPVGTDVVTSISRRFIVPQVADNVYQSNLMFHRLNSANRRIIQGGYQVEQPLMYAKMAAGGPYSGYQLLNIAPTDSILNGAWQWKQYYSPVTVDGLTLIKTDAPDAIANFLNIYFAQAEMDLADQLGNGVWSDGVTNTLNIDGIAGAVDNGTLLSTYGSLSRSTYTWWKAQEDRTTTATTLSAYRSLMGNCTQGGRHPTIIVGTQLAYNYFYNQNTSIQRFPSQPGGQDEQLAQAGYNNLLFDGVPFTVDSHISTAPGFVAGTGANTGTGNVFMLNEDFMFLYVSPKANFTLEDFQTAINQDAMVAKLLWAGNIIFSNVGLSGKFTTLTS